MKKKGEISVSYCEGLDSKIYISFKLGATVELAALD